MGWGRVSTPTPGWTERHVGSRGDGQGVGGKPWQISAVQGVGAVGGNWSFRPSTSLRRDRGLELGSRNGAR